MENRNGIVMPRHYSVISGEEKERIAGGAVDLVSILNLISYILSGLNISFGTNNYVNSDNVTTTTQSTTTGIGGTTVLNPGSTTQTQSTVDSDSSGRYFNITGSLNLGGIFEAIADMFL
ncbi:MAG: hypothetical protein H9864_05770 [Candidatus Faecalibacterium intestinavium]|uniref:Uncharacterized protein n=1 Tax=Candidatus Faecalibacterium intestinavium TaxID=2838580 RepID=A0A9E2NQK4_9FIRM|nr:hypothetical protein [Candidatus Faecalibacterium intestinavium]